MYDIAASVIHRPMTHLKNIFHACMLILFNPSFKCEMKLNVFLLYEKNSKKFTPTATKTTTMTTTDRQTGTESLESHSLFSVAENHEY